MEELGFQIIGQPYYADEPSTVIMHYLRILQDPKKILNSALKNLHELPE